MGIFRHPNPETDTIDLRRPRIPKAPPIPEIRGPRGGPAYRPDPRDQELRPEVPPSKDPKQVAKSEARAPEELPSLRPRGWARLLGRGKVLPVTLGTGFVATLAELVL